jgi:cytoskeleton protein RodZ
MNDAIDNEAIETSQPAPGQQLAEAREARGWSIPEIAQRLKFSARQIQALEADAYNALPGVTIVRGMVRSYAKALGLDPDPLVAEIEHRMDNDPLTIVAKPSLSVPLRASMVKKTIPLYLIALGLLVLVGAAAWWGLQYWRANQPVQPTASAVTETTADTSDAEEDLNNVVTAPVDVPVDAATVADEQIAASASLASLDSDNKRIELQFKDDAWVEVKDGDGKMLMAQLNAAQTQATLQGKPPFTLVIGNASSVRLSYEGRAIELGPSTHGDVARLNLE